MLPEKIELEVVTPARHVLDEMVESIEMPGKDGYLGILPGHAPLLTELGVGILTYRKGAEVRKLTVVNGYAEVLPDRVKSTCSGRAARLIARRPSLRRLRALPRQIGKMQPPRCKGRRFAWMRLPKARFAASYHLWYSAPSAPTQHLSSVVESWGVNG
jgi:hypothetical protein